MPTRATTLDRIGEQKLILPILVTRALAAYARLTYYMLLLQTAQARAFAPDEPAPSLRDEREASGVTDSSFDRIVAGSSTIGSNALHIPQAESIVGHLFEELRLMLPPLEVAGQTRPDVQARFEIYQQRLEELVVHAPLCQEDQLIARAVPMLTALPANGHDTANQLATDLHDELTRLQSDVVEEIIDGARVLGVAPADRPLVRAFMKGVHETAPLKLDHPGLETMVTGEERGFAIQTELDSMEAQFVVVTIADLSTIVTYTDVRPRRIRFLQDMLRPYGVQWSAVCVSPGADYDVSVGHFTAETPERLERYLTFLGSRLVFLIDWNRARKRLARHVTKAAATSLLKWAADTNVGHCAFLHVADLGVLDAVIERAAPVHGEPGRLDEWLGEDAARAFLTEVLRVTLSGLVMGRSLTLVEDDIERALIEHLQTADVRMLENAAEHATIIAALTERVRLTLVSAFSDEPVQQSARTSELTRRWSAHIDQLVVTAFRRRAGGSVRDLRTMLAETDGAADALEKAVSLLTLLPDTIDSETLAQLVGLADLVLDTVLQLVRCLEDFCDLSPTPSDSAMESFLVNIERLVDQHRQAIDKRRALSEWQFRSPSDSQHVHVVVDVAHGFVRTATALARCGRMVRDHVLSAQPRERVPIP